MPDKKERNYDLSDWEFDDYVGRCEGFGVRKIENISEDRSDNYFLEKLEDSEGSR